MKRLLVCMLPALLGAQSSDIRDSLRVYYVGKPVGYERYTLAATDSGRRLTAELDYVDRGRRVRVLGIVDTENDFTTRRLRITNGVDPGVLTSQIAFLGGTVQFPSGPSSNRVFNLPKEPATAIVGHAPASQHLVLMKYWMARGRPRTVQIVNGGRGPNTFPVTIVARGRDTLGTHLLDRFTVNGVNWGNETVWLDQAGRLAGLATRAGNLTFNAVRVELESHYAKLMAIATADRIRELSMISATVNPVASAKTGSVALVGATVVDATGKPDVTDATVLVTNGRIAAVGPRATIRLAAGVRTVDVKGKTILPGLWDSHAHLTQMERAPGYLAVGVTTARDMGSETGFIVALRQSIDIGGSLGPHLVLAGLVDGGGPNSFGETDATSPEEGRAVVQRYKALGFEQIKLYNQLKPVVVGAITREAHARGMIVTGHVPNALGLRAAVDSGQDQIAHLAIGGDAASDSVRQLVAWLKSKGIGFDPTPSWNELNLHATSEPVSRFVPGVEALPPVLSQRIAAMGSAQDSATTRRRLTQSLTLIKALHDAGVPIVAGTDMGVPGYSVYREIEIYEEAGFSRIEAIRTATAVAAAAAGVGTDVGTIEVGKRADLIILDKNPMESLRNLYTTRMVMKGGVLYRTADIARAIRYQELKSP